MYSFHRATCSFVEQGVHNSSICRQDNGGSEDVEMGEKVFNNLEHYIVKRTIQENAWKN